MGKFVIANAQGTMLTKEVEETIHWLSTYSAPINQKSKRVRTPMSPLNPR
jgi:hypothetical protein